MKEKGEKIAMLTAYDYTMATILDDAGIDIILVGDSAANVMAGHDTTLPITLEQMIYHAQCVVRGVKRAYVLVDLPFGTYQGNANDALHSAVRIMKESGAHGVKLEGSYGLRAKEDAEADKLLSDAVALQESGCFSLLLEKIPASLGKKVSECLYIPTIGIGAGKYCDGQVLVVQDMMEMNKGFKPRFLREYAKLFDVMTDAATRYIADVKAVDFPNESEQY